MQNKIISKDVTETSSKTIMAWGMFKISWYLSVLSMLHETLIHFISRNIYPESQ